MHHPGPPRFVATGEAVELAPRNPDPDATYGWELLVAPASSSASVGDGPVEHLVPDLPGTYMVRLSAPDGEHDLTVRAYEGSARGEVGDAEESGVSGGPLGGEGGGHSGPDGYAGGGTAPVGDGGRPRLTLDPTVEGDEVVVTADPSPHPDGEEPAADIDVEFLLDDRDDVDRGAVRVEDRRLRLPVAALAEGRTRVHAVAVGEHGHSVPDAVAFTRARGATADGQGVSVTAERLYDPPRWGTESVIYEIYVRTFADSDDGSVFDAIVDRLDYVASLGVDVLWLTPVLENDHAPHGYNITDFFAIAEDLGERDDYERFVEAAHDRGMNVLFDLVCNHSARTHPYFVEAAGDPDSEYRDWYEWRTETEPETYFDWPHIANFDFEHLPVRRHLLDAVDEWAPLVDGFRCDMAWAVPNGFWRELRDRCKAREEEFLLLDETIPYIPDFQGGVFDVHFDSTTYHALRQVGHGQDAEAVLDAVDNRARIGFPDHAGFMLYAENHDETRYIADCGRPAAKAAAGAVFTLPGAAMLYAGQEFGQLGRRDDLAWEHADEPLQDHVRRLAELRGDHPALSASASFTRVDYAVRDGDPSRVVAYGRGAEQAEAVVVLHFGEGTATVTVPAATGREDRLTGEDVAAAGDAIVVDSVVVLPAAIPGGAGR